MDYEEYDPREKKTCLNHTICNCVCHRDSNVVHFEPCCQPCPKCGQNVFFDDTPDDVQEFFKGIS